MKTEINLDQVKEAVVEMIEKSDENEFKLVKKSKGSRRVKSILERKDAKEIVELFKANPSISISQVAKKRGIWYNVANYLVKELVNAGYVDYTFKRGGSKKIDSVFNKMSSKQKEIIKEAFGKVGVVSNKELIKKANVQRNTPAMKADIKLLEDAGFVKSYKDGAKVLFKRIK